MSADCTEINKVNKEKHFRFCRFQIYTCIQILLLFYCFIFFISFLLSFFHFSFILNIHSKTIKPTRIPLGVFRKKSGGNSSVLKGKRISAHALERNQSRVINECVTRINREDLEGIRGICAARARPAAVKKTKKEKKRKVKLNDKRLTFCVGVPMPMAIFSSRLPPRII